MRRSLALILSIATVITLGAGCSGQRIVRTTGPTVLESTHSADWNAPPQTLKAHMHNGDVVVLDGWRLDTIGRKVFGQATRYDLYRRKDSLPASAPHSKQPIAMLSFLLGPISAVCASR